MAGDLYLSNGVLVTDQGTPTGAEIRGPGNVLLTPHDALYALASEMESGGTLVTANGADTGIPRWSLADAATSRVKWTWPIPVGWDAVAVRFGWDNESAGAGNVVFTFAYRLIYLGETNVNTGAVTTISPAAIAAGAQYAFTYSTPTEMARIATATGGLGDKPFMQCALTRLGGDAADTLGGAAAVIVTTATRVA